MYPTTEETPVNDEPVKEVPVAHTTVPETNTMSFARLFAYGSPKTIMELYDLEVSEGVSHEEALEYIIRSVRWGCNVVGSKT